MKNKKKIILITKLIKCKIQKSKKLKNNIHKIYIINIFFNSINKMNL